MSSFFFQALLTSKLCFLSKHPDLSVSARNFWHWWRKCRGLQWLWMYWTFKMAKKAWNVWPICWPKSRKLLEVKISSKMRKKNFFSNFHKSIFHILKFFQSTWSENVPVFPGFTLLVTKIFLRSLATPKIYQGTPDFF